jgi:hypothetical protein
MTKNIEDDRPYYIRRNLAGHQENFDKLTYSPQGNCKLCAAVYCELNVTPKEVLIALQEGDMGAVDIPICDDEKDDPVAMKANLRKID